MAQSLGRGLRAFYIRLGHQALDISRRGGAIESPEPAVYAARTRLDSADGMNQFDRAHEIGRDWYFAPDFAAPLEGLEAKTGVVNVDVAITKRQRF